jgi:hypothetical protein
MTSRWVAVVFATPLAVLFVVLVGLEVGDARLHAREIDRTP